MAPQLKAAPCEELTPIEDLADHWEVTTKTVSKWAEIVYLAWDVHLPKNGPFPTWGRELLEITAKHISQKASLYFAETQETRRLKGVEFVRKIRHMRKEGHFQDFEKFRKFQNSEALQPDPDDDLETLAELGEIAREQDEQLHNAQRLFEAREDEQVERLATFIENSDQRKMRKLARRLKTRRTDNQVSQTLDCTFTKELPGAS
jgi:hypothetical protein